MYAQGLCKLGRSGVKCQVFFSLSPNKRKLSFVPVMIICIYIRKLLLQVVLLSDYANFYHCRSTAPDSSPSMNVLASIQQEPEQ